MMMMANFLGSADSSQESEEQFIHFKCKYPCICHLCGRSYIPGDYISGRKDLFGWSIKCPRSCYEKQQSSEIKFSLFPAQYSNECSYCGKVFNVGDLILGRKDESNKWEFKCPFQCSNESSDNINNLLKTSVEHTDSSSCQNIHRSLVIDLDCDDVDDNTGGDVNIIIDIDSDENSNENYFFDDHHSKKSSGDNSVRITSKGLCERSSTHSSSSPSFKRAPNERRKRSRESDGDDDRISESSSELSDTEWDEKASNQEENEDDEDSEDNCDVTNEEEWEASPIATATCECLEDYFEDILLTTPTPTVGSHRPSPISTNSRTVISSKSSNKRLMKRNRSDDEECYTPQDWQELRKVRKLLDSPNNKLRKEGKTVIQIMIV